MKPTRHKLLARQLRRVFGADGTPPPEVERLLDLVDDAYRNADEDRRLVERSLELTSMELHERSVRLNAFFDNAPFAMGIARVVGSDVLFVSGNPAAVRSLGTSSTSPTSLERTSLPVAVRESWRDAIARAASTGAPERFQYHVGTGASSRAYSTTITAIEAWGDDDTVCYVVEDVTERAQLFEQLAQRDRLATVGTLAAGVAHEVNNPLTYMLINLTCAIEDLEQLGKSAPELTRELGTPLSALRDAAVGAGRVQAIVRDLKAFSRAEAVSVGAVDLRTVIEFATKFAGPDIRRRAQLVVDVRPTPLVFGDETRLGQVLLNLLVNAVEAIPRGRPSAHVITVRSGIDPTGSPYLDVSDTGGGIPADVLPRIFDPFFTMRSEGGGTGLGLAIVKTIMNGFRGDVQVLRSRPGEGTTFRVTFAIPTGAELGNVVEVARVVKPARRGRVLVIDDDPSIRTAIARALGREHDVVLAAGGREALVRLASDRTFDLVLCDLRMPEVDGIAVFERTIQGTELEARFAVVTADPGDATLRALRARSNVTLIAKPFEPSELRRKACELIDAASVATEELRASA